MRDDPSLRSGQALDRPTASVEAPSGGLTPPDASVPRICVVCGAQAGVCLVVAPACRSHGTADAFSAALAEARKERDQWAYIAEQSQALVTKAIAKLGKAERQRDAVKADLAYTKKQIALEASSATD